MSARESGFDTVFRTSDAIGNLYETQDKSDRIYGAGSRLEQSVIDLKERWLLADRGEAKKNNKVPVGREGSAP